MTHSTEHPPEIHHAGEEERKVTWLELFYDLVYVAAIIQLGNALSKDVSWVGVMGFVALFVPIWWSWTGITFYMNRFAEEDVWTRLLIFTQIGFIAILAMSVPKAFGELGVQFTLAYVGIRAILIVLYARAGQRNPFGRPLTRRYAIGFSIAALIWLLSVFVPPPARYAVWALGMLVDFAVPLSSRRLNALLPPDVPHMSERYGLFTIIVMGEAFVKVVSSAPEEPLAAAELVLGALGLVVVGALWWIYFDRVAGSPVKPVGRAPYVWIYSHLPLAIGLTAFGVGIKKIVFLEGYAHIPDGYRLLVGSAVAAVLVFVMLIELATTLEAGAAQVKLRTSVQFGCAAIALLLAVLGAGLSPVVFMALLAAAAVAPVLAGLFEMRHQPAHD